MVYTVAYIGNTMDQGPMLVTAAVITRGGSVLMCKRSPDSRFGAGLWEFPGGKVEFAETPQDCLAREMDEELELPVKVLEHLETATHVYKDQTLRRHVVVMFYRCIGLGEPAPARGPGYRWVDRDLITSLDITPADRGMAARLVAEDALWHEDSSEPVDYLHSDLLS